MNRRHGQKRRMCATRQEVPVNKRMSRSKFLVSACQIGACACVGALVQGVEKAFGEECAPSQPGDPLVERAVKRMEFVDVWVKNFFGVLDDTVDEPTRRKLMFTNGKVCYQTWIKSTGQKSKVVPFEEWARKVKDEVKDGSVQVEGNVIHFQYLSSAETGQASRESVCLCPLVESKVAGMSKTYCQCSVGYVREMFEQKFARPVEVELIESVLYGAKRCRFKITVG
jgi:hypothetical protein